MERCTLHGRYCCTQFNLLVWFQVAMNDAVIVDIFHSEQGFSEVTSGQVEWHYRDVLQQGCTISSLDELHHHTKVFLLNGT